MNKRLRDGLIKEGAELVILRNWADYLLARHTLLHKKAEAVAAISNEKIASEEARLCKKEVDEFLTEYGHWGAALQKASANVGKEVSGVAAAIPIIGKFISSAGRLAEKYWPAIYIGAPTLAGAGAAYIQNKLTSPKKEDLENIQRKIYLNILRTKVADLRRRKAMEAAKAAEREPQKQPRSIRI